MDRPSVDQYFIDMTHLVKGRGTCPRRQVGAVIVKDKRVLTTGYNGAPRNFDHPCDIGCIRDELGIPSGMMADVCPCLHAEQNAIIQAATTGVSIEGADVYCTTQPCTQCSRMIANCGIRRVIFEEEYADPLSIGLLVTAGVELWKWDAEVKEAHRYGQSNTFEQAREALRQKWKDGAFSSTVSPNVTAELNDALAHAVKPTATDRPASGASAGQKAASAPVRYAKSARAANDIEAPEPKLVHPDIKDLTRVADRETVIRELARTKKERLAAALAEAQERD